MLALEVLAIPGKRFERPAIQYLSPGQVHALLHAPSASTQTGFRDRVLLALMYNTGARVSEIAGFKSGDIQLGSSGYIHIHGKGRKQRTVPLWRETARLLRHWMRRIETAPEAPLLPNARGGHMTRSGIEHRLRLAVRLAKSRDASLSRVRVSPHTLRHTTAVHLLQSGVDLSVIAMWLGHESIQTTHQYLEADLESKRRALNRLQTPGLKRPKAKRPQRVIQFLRSL